MAGPRHRARELALKVLFQLEHSPGDDVDEALAYHAAEDGQGGEEHMFARELVYGVIEHQAELDEVIRNASRNWKLEQMGRVDRIVLRIAIYEITVAREVPVKAAINESIELAKTFSGEESGRFVNGVLGKVAETVAGVRPRGPRRRAAVPHSMNSWTRWRRRSSVSPTPRPRWTGRWPITRRRGNCWRLRRSGWRQPAAAWPSSSRAEAEAWAAI